MRFWVTKCKWPPASPRAVLDGIGSCTALVWEHLDGGLQTYHGSHEILCGATSPRVTVFYRHRTNSLVFRFFHRPEGGHESVLLDDILHRKSDYLAAVDDHSQKALAVVGVGDVTARFVVVVAD